MALLEARGLCVNFGGVAALSDVDITLHAGEVVGVIGPNGAGKSTLFNALTGLAPLHQGQTTLDGAPLRRPRAWRHVVAGVGISLALAVAVAVALLGPEALWRTEVVGPYQVQRVVAAAQGADAEAFAALPAWPARLADLIVGAPQLGASRRGYLIVDGQGVPQSPAYATLAAAQAALGPQAAASRAGAQAAWWRLGLAIGFGGLVGAALAMRLFARSRTTPSYIAQAGVARTFQNLRLFARMSVLDNVRVALRETRRSSASRPAWPGWGPALAAALWFTGLLTAWLSRTSPTSAVAGVLWAVAVLGAWVWLGVAGVRASAQALHPLGLGIDRADPLVEGAMQLLQRVGLAGMADREAATLAYGDMRRLEIARALATRPRVLLLDEPAAGMNATETQGLRALIEGLRRDGPAILLIEHDMPLVMGLADRVVVLESGRKIADGPPQAVQADPRVIGAYLGDTPLQEGEHAAR